MAHDPREFDHRWVKSLKAPRRIVFDVQALGAGVPLLRAGSMEEAIRSAYAAAAAGDAVLLSPACASYDMFRSYVHRGECFVQAVHALAKDEEARRGE